MKIWYITVPVDKAAAHFLDYDEALPKHLIEIKMLEADFNHFFRDELIGYHQRYSRVYYR